MKQIDARITELVARLTALERERAEILAEINTLRSGLPELGVQAVPADVGRPCQDLVDGIDAPAPAVAGADGVVPYLRRDAISAILRFMASVPRSEVVFDYSEPLENYSPERRANVAAVAARTAALGEPWLSYFDPSDLSQDLHERGFQQQEDLGLADIAVRYLGAPKRDATGEAGPHVIHAR